MVYLALLGGRINGATALIVFGGCVSPGGSENLHGGKIAVASCPMKWCVAILFVQVMSGTHRQ